jgi:hypothetical protein
MSYGISHTSPTPSGTYTEAKMHYPSSNNHHNPNSSPSIVVRSHTNIIPDKLRASMDLTLHPFRRRNYHRQQYGHEHHSLSPSLYQPSSLNIGFCTIHDNDYEETISTKHHLPHFQLYWNVFNSVTNNIRNNNSATYPYHMKLIQPRTTATTSTTSTYDYNTICTSQTELSYACSSPSLRASTKQQLQLIFTRFTSKISCISTGIQLDTNKGLSWLFRWKRGDFCINVPIQLSNIVLGSGGNSSSNNVLFLLSSSYIGFLTCIIDTIIGNIIQQQIMKRINSTLSSPSNVTQQEQHQLELQEKNSYMEKVKKDAQLQMTLMKRKAMVNKRIEEEKNGLVIVSAMYGYITNEKNTNDDSKNDNDDGIDTCFDVTIPLQFWVSDSRLLLSSNSKSQMLGFYDVKQDYERRRRRNDSNQHRTVGGLHALWDFWFHSATSYDDDNASLSTMKRNVVQLKIRYKFDSQLHEMTIHDDEALSLPSSLAMKVD